MNKLIAIMAIILSVQYVNAEEACATLIQNNGVTSLNIKTKLDLDMTTDLPEDAWPQIAAAVQQCSRQ
jgi:hypothetical protein